MYPTYHPGDLVIFMGPPAMLGGAPTYAGWSHTIGGTAITIPCNTLALVQAVDKHKLQLLLPAGNSAWVWQDEVTRHSEAS